MSCTAARVRISAWVSQHADAPAMGASGTGHRRRRRLGLAAEVVADAKIELLEKGHTFNGRLALQLSFPD